MRKLIVIMALCALLCGCSLNNGGNNGEVKFYKYADDKEIFLSGYLQSWEINEEQFKWVKESGINHYYINLSSTVSRMSASLEYCDQFGLKAIPMTCWGSNDKKSFTEHPLDATIRDYESFGAFVGWFSIFHADVVAVKPHFRHVGYIKLQSERLGEFFHTVEGIGDGNRD